MFDLGVASGIPSVLTAHMIHHLISNKINVPHINYLLVEPDNSRRDRAGPLKNYNTSAARPAGV
ncbi:MAG: hypothetical protein HY547_00185 [Elusimicrobia bacterium]|nr:hypothetical protein [Elusimicrobiota bacterium]